jgi:hypothetical protein
MREPGAFARVVVPHRKPQIRPFMCVPTCIEMGAVNEVLSFRL